MFIHKKLLFILTASTLNMVKLKHLSRKIEELYTSIHCM
ncbi:hypothetical protein CEV31_3146 [Brucella thiophenivorans]|uniref:Uncharacterized protein n=1 Tax=Brucella thiophenivorans TaxID=571255 RepID=A0A256FK52_9HYPH|nr:hypothetical protein CEV31_3146 [Brucella thiophenivorans]